jgi:DNA-directed RNA polymerase subunit RPC12/RpoP
MKLKCELCGKEFEAGRERPINICPECIEKLRKKGLGPEQLLGRKEVKDLVLRIMRRES